ncbi:MAG: hypothetical protein RIT45_586 [Pseudomonadota bacterium]
MTFDLFDERPATPAAPSAISHPLVDGLNPEQRQAVLVPGGPVLVLAGAGSGKTRVITHRIAWVLERHRVVENERAVQPWQILAVTFSNKAAGEMRHRLESLIGPDAGQVWLGTFHAIGVRLLRQLGEHAGIGRSFTIYDRDDQKRMLVRVMRALGVSEKTHAPRAISSWIDAAKNACREPGHPDLPEDEVFDRVAHRVYAAYEAEMRRADAVDFGDLLMLPVKILRANDALRVHWAQRFVHILVDEFQDTNAAQYELLELLSSEHNNLTVVGDDDQSIYSWRGAEIDNILGFPEAHPGATVVRLERNYRSTDVILATSGAVVKQNRKRHDKTLWTETVGGEKVTLHESATDRDEADWVARAIERELKAGVPLAEIAVFYRTNAQSRVIEEAMNRFRLPYVVVGGLRFYERAEIKDLLAYCRLLVNAEDTASWLRVVNTPTRGIGARTVELVEEHARLRGVSVPAAANDLVARGEGGRSREKLALFVSLIERMRTRIAGLPADEAGSLVLRESGLRDALLAEGGDEAESRLENLGELLSGMAEHARTADDPSLLGFLETVALVSDIDALKAGKQYASLMTMHAAKGLEFDVTFVTGLESNLIPHNNVDGNEDEERRLLYVAMTRARKRMSLTYARMRMRFGREEIGEPSPFLRHLPREHVHESADPGGFSYGSRSMGGGRPASAFSWGGGRTATGRLRFGGSSQVARVEARDDGSRIERIATAPSADTGERVIQREASGDFQVGGKARHAQFGVGEVMDVAGYGPTARITVRFGRTGVRKVLARFLTPA